MIFEKQPISARELPCPQALISEDAVFFDIETTGLSHRTSHLYMIGAFCREGEEFCLLQWFLQRPSEEKEVLELFAEFLKPFRTLIHYNGSSFDLPYLQDRCALWGLPDPFPKDRIRSLDLYRELRSAKKMLHLSSMKQKDLEQAVGFPRKDQMSGKDLIQVYHRYLNEVSDDDLQLLLLHNHDDLTGMLAVFELACYLNRLKDALVQMQSPETAANSPSDGFLSLDPAQDPMIQNSLMTLQLTAGVPCPAELTAETEEADLCIRRNEIRIRIRGIRGSFRHYYSNYRDYYYLPLEDTAIHKSVGVYVDPSCREKAKADTCYTKKEGLFFFQPFPVFPQDFRKDSRKGPSYFPVEETEKNPSLLPAYAAALTAWLIS